MTAKKFDEKKLPENGWNAGGNVKMRDAKKILKNLTIRCQIVSEYPDKVFWRLSRNRTEIMVVEADASMTRQQILHLAKRLEIDGFKEAFERILMIPIPQDYLDEVGWKVNLFFLF